MTVPPAREDCSVLIGIDTREEADQLERDPAAAAELVARRHRAFARLVGDGSRPCARPIHAVSMEEAAGLRELPADQLTVPILRSALRRHGSLLVRGLIPSDAVERLVTDIDEAFDARRHVQRHAPTAETAPWYTPFAAFRDESTDFARATIEAHDGLQAADSPRTLLDLLAVYEQAGLRQLLTDYLGDRPALSVKKTTLRRARVGTDTDWWHQDGAFLGTVDALNIWLSLSHCGVDAPSLDIVGQRVDEILPTGTEGADFDWSIGPAVVDRFAQNSIERPVFEPGDALFFDEMLVHKTGTSPDMTMTRYAIEAWFFAPAVFPLDRVPLVF